LSGTDHVSSSAALSAHPTQSSEFGISSGLRPFIKSLMPRMSFRLVAIALLSVLFNERLKLLLESHLVWTAAYVHAG
jgi:hypothetical protein